MRYGQFLSKETQSTEVWSLSWLCIFVTVVVLGCGPLDEADLDESSLDRPERQEQSSAETPAAETAEEDYAVAWCGVQDEEGKLPHWGRVLSNLPLTDLSLYQGIEIPLLSGARDLEPTVQVVAGRALLVRAFVDPLGGEIADGARLILRNDMGEAKTFDIGGHFLRKSAVDQLQSTYNFRISGKLIEPSSELRIEFYRIVHCRKSHKPPTVQREFSSQFYPLHAREVGAMEVVIVPIRFDGDGSGRMPDMSPEHIQELQDFLYAMFPVPEVIFRVHETVGSSETTMEAILSQVLHLRADERPAPHVAYFGLVNPDESMQKYCGASCVAGVSAVGSASGASTAGVGIGFRGAAAETFLHELGHIHRLKHSPCGAPLDADSEYPHDDAKIGAWGYDMRTNRLIDPGGEARDFMSYCDPTWISDYNFQRLMDRRALIGATRRADIVYGAQEAGPPPQNDVYEIASLPPHGTATWLAQKAMTALSEEESAEILDE